MGPTKQVDADAENSNRREHPGEAVIAEGGELPVYLRSPTTRSTFGSWG